MREDVSQNDFSIELFPPKGPKGAARLEDALAELGALNPAFFSVTFGAGGTTRSGTLDTVSYTHLTLPTICSV